LLHWPHPTEKSRGANADLFAAVLDVHRRDVAIDGER
jgi:hypothetical protein